MEVAFRNLRRLQLAMADREGRELLQRGEHAVISVLSPDGYPYAFPMSYVFLDGHIYFHGAQDGHKMECLKHSNKASFAVVGQTKVIPEKLTTSYESVVGFGRAFEVTGPDKEKALLALVAKYAPGFEEKGQNTFTAEGENTVVIRIDIQHLTGKRNKST